MKTKVSILILTVFVVSCFSNVLLAKTSDVAIAEIRSSAKANGLSEADTNTAVAVLTDLVDKGIPVKHALEVVKTAIDKKCSGNEIAAIAKSLGETVEKEGSAKEIAAIARICVEKGIKNKEVAKIMLKTQEAMGKDVSARQLRILTDDLLTNGSDVDGLSVAIEAVGNSVAEGFSPEESRKSVAMIALKGLKDGLRGEALANEIRKEAQRRSERGKIERERERTRWSRESYSRRG